MALRVTQSIMYSTFTTQMNSNLSNLMESNIQSASQKRINRPSDDAAGAGKVVNLNASIAKLKQYQDNVGQAKGWLSLGASVLGDGDGSVQAVLTRIMIPLTKPGIISGITMVFVPSLTAFAIPDILGGGKVMLIGNIIEQEFSTSMNWHLGSGLSIALMIFVLISMIFTSNEEEGKERRAW